MQHHFIGLIYINIIEQIRDYKKYLLLLVLPALIMMFIIIGTMVAKEKDEEAAIIHVGLQMDMSNIYGNLLRESFFSAEHFEEFVEVDEVASSQGLGDVYDAHIRVPEDFFESLMYFRYSPVEVSIESDNPVVTYLISGVMGSYGNYIRSVEASVVSLYEVMKVSGFDQDLRYRYNESIAFKLIKMLLNRGDAVQSVSIGRYANLSEATYAYVGIMVFFVWLISLFIGIKWLEENHQVLLSRYLVSGRSMLLYIIAYYVAIAFCLFVVTSLWHFMAMTFLSGEGDTSLLVFGLNFLIICFDLSIVLLLANIIKNKHQLILVFASIGLILCVAGGTIIPIYEMSPLMLSVAKLTPNFWMIQNMCSAMTLNHIDEVQKFAIILVIIAMSANVATALLIKRQWER